MNQKLSVLIIEDHPLTSYAYKSAFEKISATKKEIVFKIDIVNDSDSALEKIELAEKENGIDIVFLDISLPPSKNGKIQSGEDLGIKIKRVLPKTKIIVSTTHYDNFRIHSILKNIDPDGFLVKVDVDSTMLVEAIEHVIAAPPYYSHTVLKSIRKQITNVHVIDTIDRQLLYELSIGTKMTELPNIIPMSKGGIEKRKRQLKELFGINETDDRKLILLAKEKGFI